MKDLDEPAEAAGRKDILAEAVGKGAASAGRRIQDGLFTAAFRGLVYAQIWEDPEIDLEALQLGPGKRMITIASGGCNALSYLTADPHQIIAVDLNPAHVALVNLKIAGVRHAPHYHAFYRFFGDGAQRDNPRFYDRYLRPHLDRDSRDYWDWRDPLWRRRIGAYSRNIYRHGLLGMFITAGHAAARSLGVRLKDILHARDRAEQQKFFDEKIAPMFDAWVVKWISGFKASLFGLGIPPAQYDALAREGGGDMAVVLKRRLEKLLCDFPLSENYFAWQALTLGYAGGDGGPLPPYLQQRHFAALRQRIDRLTIENASYIDRLGQEPDRSLDGYVLLDAQDWMSDAQLNALWSEITRTAAPGARVIFRTADGPSLLPGRVRPEILDRWRYEEAQSQELHRRDRSAIYGGFHLYVREGAVG